MADCFDALRKALSPDISDKEITEFLKQAEDLKKASESNAEAMSDFRQKMMAKIEAQRELIAKYKMEKAQNVLKNNERWSRMMQTAYEGKPWEALAAESQGARNYIARGGNNGIRNIADSISNAILRPLRAKLDALGALEYMKNGALDKEVSQELYELRPGGQPGVSKNPMAQQVANLFRAANDRLRLEYKNAGYPIGNIPGYIVRQTHDFLKIKEAGFEKWSQDIGALLDHDKTFGEGVGDKEKTAFLKAVYNDIVNQHWGARDVPNGVSDKFLSVTERGAGSRLSGSRSLHFSDGESFNSYNASYGRGNLLQVLADTVDRDSRNIAQLKKYGTNPLDSFAADYEKMERYYSSDAAKEKFGEEKAQKILEKLQGQKKSLMAGFKIAAGISEPVGDSLPAKLSSMARALNNMSLLGMSVFKKPTELAYGTFLTKSATGESFLNTTYQIAKDFLTLGLPGSEKEQSALNKLLINYIDDSNASLFTDRYGGGYNEPGMLSRASDLMYKFSGINAHTNRGRIAIGATIARILESHAEKPFEELPGRLQGNLSRYEIGPKEWNAIRAAQGTFDHDGSKALLPELVKDPEAQQKYMNFMNELTEMSVLHSNIPTMRAIRGNIDPNTVPGMLWTMAMQYKSVALMMHDVSERVTLSDPNGPTQFLKAFNYKNGGDLYNNLIPMMAYGSALYYLSDSLKRELRGEKPMDPYDPQTGIKSFAGGAGAGLYADFLLGQEKKFSGESLFKTAVGPTGSKLYDLADNMGKIRAGQTAKGASGLVKQAEDLVPGQTLPFARSALDSLLFDHIQNAIDPEYTEKRELRKLKRERGQ